jgi:hypothetical protein
MSTSERQSPKTHPMGHRVPLKEYSAFIRYQSVKLRFHPCWNGVPLPPPNHSSTSLVLLTPRTYKYVDYMCTSMHAETYTCIAIHLFMYSLHPMKFILELSMFKCI